ncbi:hypothetical protein [Micromonospora sp. WMMD980]|uniref:hypothetical protein n=1 Tax=Micromonospora sp. WMMD980 TaxID=3016088 RepID=UPI0024179BE2|nr:hypothetical protein [Micromonospora sp. WMMD980]MDG4799451.1 hypothetical protein [Micromonospora sp. WMMD980]
MAIAYCVVATPVLTTGIAVSVLGRKGVGGFAHFLWVLPFFALYSPFVGLRSERAKARDRVNYLVQAGGVDRSVAREIASRRMSLFLAKDSAAAVFSMAMMYSIGAGVFFAVFYGSNLDPDSPSVSGALTVALAACYLVVWLASRPFFLYLNRRPSDMYALNILESVSPYSRPGSGKSDPLGSRRSALLAAARAIERHAASLDAVLPKGVTSSFAALLRAGAKDIRNFCESRQSLDRELPYRMASTVDNMVLLLSGGADSAVYRESADLWGAFDEAGRPVAERSHGRLARLKEIGLNVGRGVEPAGRATQTLVQVALLIVFAVLVMQGRVDLVEVVKRVLQ